MIENTWKWARENNRIIKHPISGGEFVDIDVEHQQRQVHEQGSRMTQTAATHYQARSLFKTETCIQAWQMNHMKVPCTKSKNVVYSMEHFFNMHMQKTLSMVDLYT